MNTLVLTLYVLMNIIFYGYMAFILIKFGKLPSFSDSWYYLSDKTKWLFTFFCWTFAFPAIIIGLQLSIGSPYQFLAALSGAGILFVGASPDFKAKDKMDRKVHYISALVGVFGITLYSFLVFPTLWFFPTTFLSLSTLIYMLREKVEEIFWIEFLSFTSYSLVLFINIYHLFGF